MLVQDLFEARQPKWTYKEKRVKDKLARVILELEGSDSATATKLAKRYERLDKTAKLLKEKRDELNAKVKDFGDAAFDPEDTLYTRVIETISFTMTLSAAEKADQKSATTKIDYEGAFKALLKLVPELQEQADAVLAQFTELVPPKDTPTKLTVKSKISEGLLSSVKKKLSGFMASLKEWALGYDAKLAVLKKQFKGVKLTESTPGDLEEMRFRLAFRKEFGCTKHQVEEIIALIRGLMEFDEMDDDLQRTIQGRFSADEDEKHPMLSLDDWLVDKIGEVMKEKYNLNIRELL